MTTAEALLRSVLCDPDDDTRRLAFADHLDETATKVKCGACKGSGVGFPLYDDGEGFSCSRCDGGRVSDGKAERAEFVRVQVELARIPGEMVAGNRCPVCNSKGAWRQGVHFEHEKICMNSESPECDENATTWQPGFTLVNPRVGLLRYREQALLPLCPLWFEVGADKTEWSRGFVSGLTWNADSFMHNAAAIFGAMPVTTVTLSDKEPINNEPEYETSIGPWWYAHDGGMPQHSHRGRFPSQHVIPQAIWFEMRDAGELDHDTPDLARAALSRACCSFGRKAAHLPPLTPAARPARVG